MALQRFKESNPVGKIDRENGIIYGVSVITGDREASGHETYVDDTMLQQVFDFGSASDVGIKARFDHPNPCASSMGTELGRFKNFSLDGKNVRADLHLNESSAKSPNGNYREYVLSLAEEDPDQFATSIVFRMGESYIPQKEDYPEQDPSDSNPFWMEHARVASLTHVDVVNEGAANDGLFSNDVEMEYLSLKAKQFIKDNSRLFEPLIKEMVAEHLTNNPINQKPMSESKKSWWEMFRSKDSQEELKAEVNSHEEKFTALEAELEAKTQEFEALKAEKEALEAKPDLTEQLTSLSEQVEALQAENDQLKALAAKDGLDNPEEVGDPKSPEVKSDEKELSAHDLNAQALKNRTK